MSDRLEVGKWHHYEKWETTMDKVHIRVEGRAKDRFITININSSARGANCYGYEVKDLIKALSEALKVDTKLTDLKPSDPEANTRQAKSQKNAELKLKGEKE